MLKKVGIVVGLATVGALALSPLAFAEDSCEYGGGNSLGQYGGIVQDPSVLGNNSYYEGVVGFMEHDQSHSASHDDDCSADNSYEDSGD